MNEYPFLCWLFGCNFIKEDGYCYCARCGRGTLDNQTYGVFWILWNGGVVRFFLEIQAAFRALWPIRRCDNCGKLMWSQERYPLCSEKCKREWVPF